MMPRRSAPPEVHSITGAQVPLSHDQDGRTRRYLFSMILRTVCFVGAVVAQGWLRWVLVAAALVLPYIAVVIANAGRESLRLPTETPVTFLAPLDSRQITDSQRGA